MTGKFLKRKLNNFRKKIKENSLKNKKIRVNKRLKSFKASKPTIISNNCWAGRVYQYLDMPYLSPTAGLYFFADDYLRFISNLKYYVGLEPEFIPPVDSKYFPILKERSQENAPLAKLDDVEIVFLHYKTEDEAREKWNRRKQRINFDNLYFKFSKMNLCTEEHMRKFASLPFKNKILLNNRKNPSYECEYFYEGRGTETEMFTDTNPFPGNINLVKIFNQKENF